MRRSYERGDDWQVEASDDCEGPPSNSLKTVLRVWVKEIRGQIVDAQFEGPKSLRSSSGLPTHANARGCIRYVEVCSKCVNLNGTVRHSSTIMSLVNPSEGRS